MGLKELLAQAMNRPQKKAGDGQRDPLEDPGLLALVFHPRKDPSTPRQDFLARDVLFRVCPEVEIGARFYPSGQGFPNLIFFHGNGEIASDYDEIARLFVERGLNLLVVDYRGYGQSSGTPTLRDMLQDALELIDPICQWLAGQGFGGVRWVMGRSLGSCPAIQVARLRGDLLSGLIVESGFADTLGLLSRIGFPTRGLQIPQQWRSINLDGIRQVKLPTLVIHGQWDQIIPLEDGMALFQACKAARKELVVIPRAGHNDLFWAGAERYMGAIASFIEQG
jgi:pimeloyl-ACP methyl ester carboxylesterase